MKPDNTENTNNLQNDKLYSRTQAADFLGVKPSTLEAWSNRKYGLPVIKISKRMVKYRLSDLIAFLEARLEYPKED